LYHVHKQRLNDRSTASLGTTPKLLFLFSFFWLFGICGSGSMIPRMMDGSSQLFLENIPESELVCHFITKEEPITKSTTTPRSEDGKVGGDDDNDENNNNNNNNNERMKQAPSSSSSSSFEVMEDEESAELQVGDHVYQWRSLVGIPFVFQHHGIVMDVIKNEEGKTTKLTIADFSNVETRHKKQSKSQIQQNAQTQGTMGTSMTATTTSRRLTLEQEGVLRTYTDTDEWHKVHYEASWWKRHVYRSGTATKARSDPVGLVLARVSFIIQHPELLPDYHVVHANCECVAFWCKTGSWSTLQASSFLELTAAGQVKSSATLAAAAAGATSTVTVPAAGVWGWFGYTSTAQVSWLSLHPMAIPGLACYAAVTVGVPAMIYATAHRRWRETSKKLCDAFWESATENPDVFAECLTHWSDRGS
jgi:hypothetical protein